MRIDKKFIDSKKVIIYGDKKQIKDFLYMFDWIQYSYIISPAEQLYNLKKLNEEELDKILVILCCRNKEQAVKDIEKYNLTYGSQYIIADDIFYLLDDIDITDINSKDIFIWGVGNTQKHLEKCLIENDYNFSIKGYVDNNSATWGETADGKEVISPENFLKLTHTYVIIASIYYDEIKTQLESAGKQEEKDFEAFTKFETRPSKMLKKTMYDVPIKTLSKCSVPFRELRLTNYGNYPCCSGLVKYPVGNPFINTPEESWNSIAMKLYRLSIENSTYSFCKRGVCKLVPQVPEVLCEGKMNYFYQIQASDCPQRLVLGLDNSCNLYCKQCREERYFAKGALLEKRMQCAYKIVESGWLEKTEEIFLSVDGEVFASEVDKIILQNYRKGKRLHIITNGILLNEDKWKLIEGKADTLIINISIDAASEKTYSELRRGGNWKQLQNNLEMLSQKRMKDYINYIDIRMVVQDKNYEEMKDFIKMGEKFHVDKVVFTRLQNHGAYSDEEYKELSLIDKKNLCLNPKLEKEFKDDVFDKEIVDMSAFLLYMRK